MRKMGAPNDLEHLQRSSKVVPLKGVGQKERVGRAKASSHHHDREVAFKLGAGSSNQRSTMVAMEGWRIRERERHVMS